MNPDHLTLWVKSTLKFHMLPIQRGVSHLSGVSRYPIMIFVAIATAAEADLFWSHRLYPEVAPQKWRQKADRGAFRRGDWQVSYFITYLPAGNSDQ